MGNPSYWVFRISTSYLNGISRCTALSPSLFSNEVLSQKKSETKQWLGARYSLQFCSLEILFTFCSLERNTSINLTSWWYRGYPKVLGCFLVIFGWVSVPDPVHPICSTSGVFSSNLVKWWVTKSHFSKYGYKRKNPWN